MMGISVASLFGYRNGTIKISRKGWSKLEQAERAAGVAFPHGIGKRSADPKQPDVGESAYVLREDAASYGVKPHPLTLDERVAKLEAAMEAMRRALENL